MENTKMNDSIILVNDEDDEIGFCEKMEVHQKGQLHRAFSLLIVDSNLNFLIQKRAKNKYHSGGLWTNACCSHPRKGEDIERSIRKRVLEELGVDIMDSSSFVLTELGKFKYIKHFDGCTEYEIDHVFLLELPSNIELHPNAAEVEELNWVNIFDLGDRLLNNPDDFTAWFPAVYDMYIQEELWNPTMYWPLYGEKLGDLLQQQKENICCISFGKNE